MQLYIGKVVENDSQKALNTEPLKGKTGAVQIYIEFLMNGFLVDQYHWFRPAQGGLGGSATFGTSCIPEKDSYVWCFYEDEQFYRKGFYIWNANLSELNPHSLYEENIQAEVGAVSTYPDVKYLYLPNKVCIALSSDPLFPEITIYHPQAFIFIDYEGTTTIQNSASNKIKLSSTGIDIEATGMCTVKGTKVTITGGILETNGVAAPTGSGPYCGIPSCIFSGAPHVGNMVTGT